MVTKTTVIEAIRSAFAGVVLGNGIGLWQADAIDNYESEEVIEQNRALDQKEDWSLISHADLQSCHSSLSFFDADGMRFHLPAFIIASLDFQVDDPLFHLTQLDEYAKTKLTTLSSKQKQTIVLYLKYCLENEAYSFDHDGIKLALKNYWESKKNKLRVIQVFLLS